MKYQKESCCDPAWATAGMSFNKKSIPASTSAPSTAAMSLSKKSVPGGETRPVYFRLEDKKI